VVLKNVILSIPIVCIVLVIINICLIFVFFPSLIAVKKTRLL